MTNSPITLPAAAGDDIIPFDLAIPQSVLDDLKDRLARTRWPERETVDDDRQGVPLQVAQELCGYWRDRYDWRRCEAMLNAFGQFRTTIDGLGIHFLHAKSPEPDALPLIITHGWPGSVVEFHKILGPLTDPAAHGGDPADAFHVVAPSLPGFGFSDRPAETGWTADRVARAWLELMRRLGYGRFVAQGGDWGSIVTSAMGSIGATELLGIHLNMVLAFPGPEDMASLTDKERGALAGLERYREHGSAYARMQAALPQTVGYGFTDSPVGQAAWIYQMFMSWTDSDGDPLRVLSRDEILDNIMLYWLGGTAASSARFYWENFAKTAPTPLALPVGCSMFPGDTFNPSRRWAERLYPNIIHWGEADRGGHFAAFEQPEIFVREVRDTFRSLR